MSDTEAHVAGHYGINNLFDLIVDGLVKSGVDADRIEAAHLKPVDEFHIGGLAATKAFMDPLAIGPETQVLDIGSGLGGSARFIAGEYGAPVTGIDLTPEFVETARKLSDLVGLETTFVTGSALDLPFDDASFDLATLFHVGMNLPDKPRLFEQAARVLRDGGRFAVYDVMQFGAHPAFPLPWSGTPEGSFLATPEDYLQAANNAGFQLIDRNDRGDVARAFFAEMQARMAAGDGPAVGLPLLMGEDAPIKAANMRAAVDAGDIQPVEMIFKKG